MSSTTTKTGFLIASLMVGGLILANPADAGKLEHGSWSPSGCGPVPAAPTGLNLASAAAYQESLKWVKDYQDKVNKYNDCMVTEANSDNDAINDFVHNQQQSTQALFDKMSEQSKRAQTLFGGKKN